MRYFCLSLWGVLSLGVSSASAAQPAASPTAERSRAQGLPLHIQTDRPSYRLGETIWYRVHGGRIEGSTLELTGPGGGVVEKSPVDASGAGKIFLSSKLSGGSYRLQVQAEGEVRHSIAVNVYDLKIPKLDVSLSVLGELHYPGGSVRAAFRVLDAKGRPIKNANVEYLATFGSVRIRSTAGKTDDEGRALIRLQLPDTVRESGHLSAGVQLKRGQAAVAAPVHISSSVALVEAFPEGGSVIAGYPNRFGILARDLDGAPTAMEGRVVDDQEQTVGEIHTGLDGLTSVTVLYERSRSYRIVVDRPTRIEKSFPLPAPTPHACSMIVSPAETGLDVRLHIAPEVGAKKRFGVRVFRGTSLLREATMVAVKKGDGHLEVSKRLQLWKGDKEKHFAKGMLDVVVYFDKRAILRRTVCLGAESPVEVEISPRSRGALLPGKPFELGVRTTLRGVAVPADLALSVFQGESSVDADFARRSVINSRVKLPLGQTVPSDVKRLDDLLLVYSAYAYPSEGVESRPDGSVPDDVGLVVRAKIKARATPEEVRGRRTAVRPSGFERLLDRARFTVAFEPRDPSHSFHPRVPIKRLIDAPGLGREARRPPQDVKLSGRAMDSRRTLFWGDRVRTDASGNATVHLRMNHFVHDLRWTAQGVAKGMPVASSGVFGAGQNFRTSFEFPDYLNVGDRVEVVVQVEVRDGSLTPIDLDFRVPDCLKPLIRNKVSFDPRLDARVQRFRFEVVRQTQAAEIRLIATRGLFQEIHTRRFGTGSPHVQLTLGRRGYDKGRQSLEVRVPKEALPGSVTMHARVSPGALSQSMDWLRRNLRYPSGCFDQFTSKNLVNLRVLDVLLEKGKDAKLLAQAWGFGRTGFKRLMTYRDQNTGAFAMFEGSAASVRPTVIAVRHLALYDRLYDGLGKVELERAIAWLESQKVPPREALYLTLSLHDSGRTWKGFQQLLKLKTESLFDRAMLVACVSSWPADANGLISDTERERLTDRLLDDIVVLLKDSGSAPTGETGWMGATGVHLTSSLTALAAVSAQQVGRLELSERLFQTLAEKHGQFSGPQGFLLSLRAFARLSPSLATESFFVSFEPGGQKGRRRDIGVSSSRPVVFHEGTNLKPGAKTNVAIRIASDQPQYYSVGCSYRTEKMESKPEAPFAIKVQSGRSASVGSTHTLTVIIEKRGKVASAQTIARIALPTGAIPDPEALKQLREKMSVQYHEVRDGFIDLYWQDSTKIPTRFSLPVKLSLAGQFLTRPSVIYPYYESGKEAYSEPVSLLVTTLSDDPKLEMERRRRQRSPRR